MSKFLPPHINFSVQADVNFGELRIDLRELKRSLRTLADTQSITHAAHSLGVTYRTLWGRLLGFDAALGCKLVGKARGRGTHLTGKGRALLAALERHDELFSPPSSERVSALSADLARALRDQPLLRLLASHDYALGKVFAASAVSTLPAVSTQLQDAIHMANAGSVECIRALLRGDADIAGYHHTTATAANAGRESQATALWSRVEDSAEFWSVALMEREQGLIVAPQLKSKVKGLADLARAGLRFVNRQRGSGTRVLLDSLMADAGMVATAISGYGHEEFTHQAVAATVAAGAADAGPGLRTAAAQFKLHFVPLATETYRIAGRTETRQHPSVLKLIAALRAEAAKLPGYTALR
jgi:molybdate transport repressor ModE-like protein